MTYMQIQELIHADTNSQIDTGQIQQDTYRYMKFCMLYISGFKFMYV